MEQLFSGDINEYLVNSQLKALTGNNPLDTKIGTSNKGIDGAFQDADGYIVIVEAKQFTDRRFQLSKAGVNAPAQMTDEWIEYQFDKLIRSNIPSQVEAGRAIEAAYNAGKIRKVVAGVDRTNKQIIYVPIE